MSSSKVIGSSAFLNHINAPANKMDAVSGGRVELLVWLEQQGRAVSMREIINASSESVSTVVHAIDMFKNDGLVKIVNQPRDDESMDLTPAGKQVAKYSQT